MKMKNLMFVSIGTLGMLGCATSLLNKKLDEKMAAESSIHSQADLREDASRVFDQMNDLTAVQRDQLLNLRQNTTTQMREMNQQSLRLRAVLIDDLASPEDQSDEVELIKKRLRTLENKRLATMFEAVEEANMILGKSIPHREAVMRGFLTRGE